jgi:hypothetical protein
MTREDVIRSLIIALRVSAAVGVLTLLIAVANLSPPRFNSYFLDCPADQQYVVVTDDGNGWGAPYVACIGELTYKTWRQATDEERSDALARRRRGEVMDAVGISFAVGITAGFLAFVAWLLLLAGFRTGRWAKHQVETFAGSNREKRIVVVDGRSINIAVSEHLHAVSTPGGPPASNEPSGPRSAVEPAARPGGRPCPGCDRMNPIESEVCECGLVLRVPSRKTGRLPGASSPTGEG